MIVTIYVATFTSTVLTANVLSATVLTVQTNVVNKVNSQMNFPHTKYDHATMLLFGVFVEEGVCHCYYCYKDYNCDLNHQQANRSRIIEPEVFPSSYCRVIVSVVAIAHSIYCYHRSMSFSIWRFDPPPN